MDAKTRLQDACGTRKNLVRGGGGKHDQIDVLCIDARGINGIPCSLLSKIHCGLAFDGNVTSFDSRALANPLVGGVDHFLEVFVGNDVFRQVGTGAGNSCKGHSQVSRGVTG